MSSGTFFAVQTRLTDSGPWAFFNSERFATAEEAKGDRDNWRQISPNYEYRAVEVHVSTEIAVVE